MEAIDFLVLMPHHKFIHLFIFHVSVLDTMDLMAEHLQIYSDGG